MATQSTAGWYLFQRFSRYVTVVRICGWLLRFKYRPDHHGDLSIEEKQRAELTVARVVQQDAFHAEIISLKKDGTVAGSSLIAPLHPFLDDEKIVWVGGRLIHSNLPQNMKHPKLLPAKARMECFDYSKFSWAVLLCGYAADDEYGTTKELACTQWQVMSSENNT